MLARDLHVGAPVRLLVAVQKFTTTWSPGELGVISLIVAADDTEYVVKLERGGTVIFTALELDQLELVS